MARKPADPDVKTLEGAVKELEAIKKLLILQLVTSGVHSTTIARAMGVDVSVVSRLAPARRVKKRGNKG